jgi:hypothetical protein
MSFVRNTSLGTILSGVVTALLLTVSAGANAGLIAYQSEAAFDLATAGWSTRNTTDFESTPAGTSYGPGFGPAGAGFTLLLAGPSAPGSTPTVGDLYWTTSGSHYLGLDNPDTALQAGDSLTFTFSRAMQAFGLYVIGTSDIGAGDIRLTTGTDSVANSATPDSSDGAGSYAFFLGFASNDGTSFDSVTLRNLSFFDPRLLNIAIDDVTLARNDVPTDVPPDVPTGEVPEPATAFLLLAGALAIGARSRRRTM